MYSQQDFKRGDIVELEDFLEVSIHNYHPNITYIVVTHPSKKKPYSIPVYLISKIISSPLPFQLGDRVIDLDNQEGEIISLTQNSITIRKSDKISSHNFELSAMPNIKAVSNKSNLLSRGGKREGSGRKSSGLPPKKRKALQLDLNIASKLPDLIMLSQLLDEFRPIAESGILRSQKLAEFYKKLDTLPYIV